MASDSFSPSPAPPTPPAVVPPKAWTIQNFFVDACLLTYALDTQKTYVVPPADGNNPGGFTFKDPCPSQIALVLAGPGALTSTMVVCTINEGTRVTGDVSTNTYGTIFGDVFTIVNKAPSATATPQQNLAWPLMKGQTGIQHKQPVLEAPPLDAQPVAFAFRNSTGAPLDVFFDSFGMNWTPAVTTGPDGRPTVAYTPKPAATPQLPNTTVTNAIETTSGGFWRSSEAVFYPAVYRSPAATYWVRLPTAGGGFETVRIIAGSGIYPPTKDPVAGTVVSATTSSDGVYQLSFTYDEATRTYVAAVGPASGTTKGIKMTPAVIAGIVVAIVVIIVLIIVVAVVVSKEHKKELAVAATAPLVATGGTAARHVWTPYFG